MYWRSLYKIHKELLFLTIHICVSVCIIFYYDNEKWGGGGGIMLDYLHNVQKAIH